MTEPHANPAEVLLDMDDCVHGLLPITCSLCKDAATGRPTGTPIQVYRARRGAPKRTLPTTGVIRPYVDPVTKEPSMTAEEWWAPEEVAWRKRRMAALKREERDQYPGRTLGPKDHSIRPINRTRR